MSECPASLRFGLVLVLAIVRYNIDCFGVTGWRAMLSSGGVHGHLGTLGGV